MEILQGAVPLYPNVRKNVSNAMIHLDTSVLPRTRAAAAYKAHLNDCIDNPTVGLLARKKYTPRRAPGVMDYVWRNKKIIESDKLIKPTRVYLDNMIKNLYPKTRFLREYIIEKGRVDFDVIKPCKGYNAIDKALIMLKKIF